MQNTLESVINQLNRRTFYTLMDDGQTVPVHFTGSAISTHRPEGELPFFTLTFNLLLDETRTQIACEYMRPTIQDRDSVLSEYVIQDVASLIFKTVREKYSRKFPSTIATIAFTQAAQNN